MRHRVLVLLALVTGLGLSLVLERLEPPPARGGTGLVSLSPALTEVICHLGAGDRLLGVADFTCHPPHTADLPRLGGAFNPNFEAILALRPGLIIAQGQAAKVRAFAHNFRIRTTAKPLILDTIADLRKAYGLIGAALDSPDAAATALAELDRDLAAAASLGRKGGGRPRVLVALGHRQGSMAGLYTTSGKTFLGELVEMTGGRNTMADARVLWPTISLEQVQAAAPEIILELHPGMEVQLEPLAADWRRTCPAVPAVARGRIHLLTQDYLLLPGPRIRNTAHQLARIFAQVD